MIFPAGHKIIQIETGSFGESVDNWRLLTLIKDRIKVSKAGTRDIEIIINMD